MTAPIGPLTPRELEVLRLVAQGLRNKEIAERLGTRESTVKNQMSDVLKKLGARNRTHAVLIMDDHHTWRDTTSEQSPTANLVALLRAAAAALEMGRSA